MLGLAQMARERGCHVVAFTRDRDRVEARERQIEAAIARACEQFPDVRIAGGMAVEKIEAFVLGLAADRRAETYRNPARELSAAGIGSLERMVEVVAGADLAHLPEEVAYLRSWVERARAALK